MFVVWFIFVVGCYIGLCFLLFGRLRGFILLFYLFEWVLLFCCLWLVVFMMFGIYCSFWYLAITRLLFCGLFSWVDLGWWCVWVFGFLGLGLYIGFGFWFLGLGV